MRWRWLGLVLGGLVLGGPVSCDAPAAPELPRPEPRAPSTTTATAESRRATPGGVSGAADRCIGHPIGRFEVSADGRWLATACAGERCGRGGGADDDTRIDVWDLTAGAWQRTLDAGLPNMALRWGAAGVLVSASTPTTGVGEARLFDAQTGRRIADKTIYCLTSLQADATGRRFAVAGCDGRIDLWHADGRLVQRPREQAHEGGDYRNAIRFLRDHQLFMVEGYDDIQRINGRTLHRLGGVSVGRVVTWAFSAEASRVAVLAFEEDYGEATVSLFVVDGRTLRRRQVAKGLTASGWLSSLAWLDDRRLVMATQSGALSVWDVATGQRRVLADAPVDQEHETGVFLAPHPDGDKLATIDHAGKLRLWDVAAGRPRELPLPGKAEQAAWSADGRWLAVTTGRRLVLFDAQGESGAERALGAPDGLRRHLAWLDGVVAVTDHELLVVRPGDGEALRLAVVGEGRRGVVTRDEAASDVAQARCLTTIPASDAPEGEASERLTRFLLASKTRSKDGAARIP